MGASEFGTKVRGKTAKEAFQAALDQAHWDHGHSGYSGTLAEKSEYVVIPVPAGADPIAYAGQLMDEDDERIHDKWGPAGCVKVSDDEFYFFGWASS